MITGLPVVTETDFELPFGGAVFRRIRTYGETPSDHAPIPKNQAGTLAVEEWASDGAFWDWNGRNWIMSENPIFLFDAHYYWYHDLPKRCYFIPDAHHAIPFVWEQTGQGQYDGRYVAPPWFDAVCNFDTDNGVPTRFYIWLYGKSVKYTIDVVPMRLGNRFVQSGDSDACGAPGGDPHDPPDDEFDYRAGIPYPGLVRSIEDRNGNRIELEYTDVVESGPFDIYDSSDPPVLICQGCKQNSNEFGQLEAVRLYPAGALVSEPAWTLLYSYREYGVGTGVSAGRESDSVLPHTLHSVHVYRGNKSTPAAGDLVIANTMFMQAESLDEVDAIDPPFLTGHYQDDWLIEARYVYGELVYSRAGGLTNGVPDYPGAWLIAPFNDPENRHPDHSIGLAHHLVKSTVTRRTENGIGATQASTDAVSMYRYALNRCDTHVDSIVSPLAGIYAPKTVDSLIDKMRAAAAYNGGNPEDITPNYLITNVKIDSPIEVMDTSDPPAVKTTTLPRCADVWMEPANSSVQPAGACGFWTGDAAARDMIELAGLAPPRTAIRNEACRLLIDQRGSEPRFYYIWNFITFPENAIELGQTSQLYSINTDYFTPSLYHFPYRMPMGYPNGIGELRDSPMNEPRWMTCVDEADPNEPYNPLWNTTPSPDDLPGILSRRILELNAAGFEIRDRTWEFPEGQTTQVQQRGFAEQSKYDCSGRIVEKRSKGWSAAHAVANGSDDHPGFIQTYAYSDEPDDCYASGNDCDFTPQDPPCNPPREPIRIYVKDGVDGDEFLVFEAERHEDQPELITVERRFRGPGADPEETLYEYVFTEDANVEPRYWAIREKTVIGPAARLTRGGSATQRPIMRTRFDERGNVVWGGRGFWDTAEEEIVAFTAQHFVYESDLGRLLTAYEDPNPTIVDYPDDFERVPPESPPPLHYVTANEYDAVYGLIRTTYPNGREMRMVYRNVPEELGVLQWVYKDLVPTSGTSYEILGPFEVNLIRDFKVIYRKQIAREAFDGNPDGDHPGYEAHVISTTSPEYDARGNTAGVTQDGGGGNELRAFVSRIGLGGISREQSPDGTITRYEYDNWGRLTRTLRGTSDLHQYWDTLPPENPPPSSDNLAVIEKRYYGTGVTDADRLNFVRHYREPVLNRYYEDPNDPQNPDPQFNNENFTGWSTQHEYDWRMREVVVTRRGEQSSASSLGPIEGYSVTWLDNLDRVRFSAEYGPIVSFSPEASTIRRSR